MNITEQGSSKVGLQPKQTLQTVDTRKNNNAIINITKAQILFVFAMLPSFITYLIKWCVYYLKVAKRTISI
jgi:hypothetical protein